MPNDSKPPPQYPSPLPDLFKICGLVSLATLCLFFITHCWYARGVDFTAMPQHDKYDKNWLLHAGYASYSYAGYNSSDLSRSDIRLLPSHWRGNGYVTEQIRVQESKDWKYSKTQKGIDTYMLHEYHREGFIPLVSFDDASDIFARPSALSVLAKDNKAALIAAFIFPEGQLILTEERRYADADALSALEKQVREQNSLRLLTQNIRNVASHYTWTKGLETTEGFFHTVYGTISDYPLAAYRVDLYYVLDEESTDLYISIGEGGADCPRFEAPEHRMAIKLDPHTLLSREYLQSGCSIKDSAWGNGPEIYLRRTISSQGQDGRVVWADLKMVTAYPANNYVPLWNLLLKSFSQIQSQQCLSKE